MIMEKEFSENPLHGFWEEIKEVERNESAAHFEHGDFNAEELTEKDRDIWERLKDGSITREDLSEYRRDVGEESESRKIFLGFISNKAMGMFLKKEIENRKK